MALTSHGPQHRGVNRIQPVEIIRLDSPVLSEVVGQVVVKTNWSGTARRGKEAAMDRAPNGRLGTTPHICSYEAVGECREVTPNIPILPREEDIAKRHWPIFSNHPPARPDLRML